MFLEMFSRREICFWKCTRTIRHKQSVSFKLYSAQAGEQCYKRSGSEAQFTDCYTLLGFDFCSDCTITTRYNDFNCNHNLIRCWRKSFLTPSGMPHHPLQRKGCTKWILWLYYHNQNHEILYGYYTTWILWHYNHNQNHEILHGYYMDIIPHGYYAEVSE